MSATTTRVLVEAAHWDPSRCTAPAAATRSPPRPASATSAASTRRSARPRPTASSSCSRRTAAGRSSPASPWSVTPPAPATITIPVDLPARITGIAIDDATTVAQPRGDRLRGRRRRRRPLTATVPPWRPDLTDPYDLVEEVARIVGYDHVPSVLPTAPSGRGLTRRQRLRRRVGRTLAGAGLRRGRQLPVRRRGRTSTRWGSRPTTSAGRVLRLANPLSSERPSMTTTLLPGLLDAVARNAGRGSTDLALFELGTVTLPHAGQGTEILPVDRRPTEGELDDLRQGPARPAAAPRHRGVRAPAPRRAGGAPGRPVEWSDALAGVREVAAALRVPTSRCARGSRAPWHPGRCAEVVAGGQVVGRAGELHPRVCTAWGVPPRTVAAEVDLGRLLELAPGRHRRARRSRTTRWPRRTSPWWSTPRSPWPRSRRRCARAPASCSSRCGCSTSTPAARSARARSRWPSRCGSGHPTGPSPRARPVPPATRRWPWPPSALRSRAAQLSLSRARPGGPASRAPTPTSGRPARACSGSCG